MRPHTRAPHTTPHTVTKVAIKEARVKELKQEILNSDRLKAHFEDNPQDLQALRHDKPLHAAKVQSHMRHIPEYLLPNKRHKAGNSKVHPSSVTFHKRPAHGSSSSSRTGASTAAGSGSSGSRSKSADPLKSFKYAGRK